MFRFLCLKDCHERLLSEAILVDSFNFHRFDDSLSQCFNFHRFDDSLSK